MSEGAHECHACGYLAMHAVKGRMSSWPSYPGGRACGAPRCRAQKGGAWRRDFAPRSGALAAVTSPTRPAQEPRYWKTPSPVAWPAPPFHTHMAFALIVCASRCHSRPATCSADSPISHSTGSRSGRCFGRTCACDAGKQARYRPEAEPTHPPIALRRRLPRSAECGMALACSWECRLGIKLNNPEVFDASPR